MIKCPNCAGTETKVKDTRLVTAGAYRRRECENCHYRFTTIEAVVIADTDLGQQIEQAAQELTALLSQANEVIKRLSQPRRPGPATNSEKAARKPRVKNDERRMMNDEKEASDSSLITHHSSLDDDRRAVLREALRRAKEKVNGKAANVQSV